MNIEQLKSKYKEQLDLLKFGPYMQDNENFYLYREKYRQLSYSTDVIIKSISFIKFHFFVNEYIYNKFMLIFRNGHWYKYNPNIPPPLIPIQFNLCILLTNNELFKIIKRTLYNFQKDYLIGYFLKLEIESSKIEELKNIKEHLNIFKDLTIDSSIYLNIKSLLEYLFELDNSVFV